MKIRDLKSRLRDLRSSRRPRRQLSAKERARRNAVYLAVATFAAAVIIPVGRPAGYSLANGVCGSTTCSQALSSLPQCTGVGRDKAEAATMTSFVRQIGTEENFNIIGAVDGRITATRTTPEGTVELYSFNDGAQAKSWVLDRSLESAAVVDSAVGPGNGAAYEGYLRIIGTAGLLPREVLEPIAVGTRFAAAEAAQDGITYRSEASGITTQSTVVNISQAQTPSLERFAARLGITESLLVTTKKSRDGQPLSISFAGPAAAGWNLGVLRTTPFDADPAITDVSVDAAGLLWRSYSLDLTRSSNLSAYESLVDTANAQTQVVNLLKTGQFDARVAAGELDANPYERMRDRIRDDATLAETQLAGDFSTAQRIDAYLRTAGLFEDHQAVHAAAGNITTADLALAGSQLAPFVSCETTEGEPEDGE